MAQKPEHVPRRHMLVFLYLQQLYRPSDLLYLHVLRIRVVKDWYILWKQVWCTPNEEYTLEAIGTVGSRVCFMILGLRKWETSSDTEMRSLPSQTVLFFFIPWPLPLAPGLQTLSHLKAINICWINQIPQNYTFLIFTLAVLINPHLLRAINT